MRHLRSLTIAGIAAGLLSLAAPVPALAGGSSVPLPELEWGHGGVNSFTSFFKTYDRLALQRGFQVYKEVCAACHGMKLLSYRNLEDLNIPADEVKAIAAQYEVADLNDEGEPIMRPATPADRFKAPFANAKAAAAANGGKAPPDLSVIVKARHGYENYIAALLTGYEDAPAGITVGEGSYYNKYYPGHIIAMAPPLYPDGITYQDGTKATVAQQAHDVTSFLAWAAEPKLEQRRRTGVMVLSFLTVMALLLYWSKRRLWADQH